MDPAANIVEAQCLAREIVAMEGSLAIHETGKPIRTVWGNAERLAELFLAYVEWRENGGFDPFADPNAPVGDPQANALLRRCKLAHETRRHVRVFPGTVASLPARYLYVVEMDGDSRGPFECGIDTDGSVSS